MSHAYQPPQPGQQPQPQQSPYGQPTPQSPYGQPTPQSPYGQPAPPAAFGMQRYGQPAVPMPTASPKSGGVALILSFLIPGLGHLYTGNPISAVLWFVAAVVSWLLITVFVGFLLLPCVYIGAMIHAYISATNFNRRHHVVR